MNNVMSLFNGLGGLCIALNKNGTQFNTFYYAEIDKYANKVMEHNYPDSVGVGDVTKWKEWDVDWGSIDLITAGFPCQSWSVAGQQKGDKDERGMLFWVTLDIIAHVLKCNPNAKFIMENVKMKKDFEEYITYHTTQALGYVEKTLINSALVSAQNRNRYYWTNFPVTQPEDKGILLKDIIEGVHIDLYDELESDLRNGEVMSEQKLNGISQTMKRALNNGKNPEQKANSLTACSYKGMGTNGMTNVLTQAGVQKDNAVVFNTADNPRIKGITEDERGSRPHRGDSAKSGISECGRILKPTASKADTVTTSHAPKVLVNESATKDNKSYSLTASYSGAVAWNSCQKKQRTMIPVVESIDENPNIYNGVLYRKLTPVECERLQTIPDNYTSCVSNTQRYKMIGNGWTTDVICHILKCMDECMKVTLTNQHKNLCVYVNPMVG